VLLLSSAAELAVVLKFVEGLAVGAAFAAPDRFSALLRDRVVAVDAVVGAGTADAGGVDAGRELLLADVCQSFKFVVEAAHVSALMG